MSKERSSQKTMKRPSAARRWARQAGSEAMSSRWISTSFSSARLALASAPQLLAHLGVGGLDQRGLAHAARAPQQGVVGGQAAGEPARVVEQLLGRAVDALEQAQRLAVDVGDGQEGLRRSLPHERFRCGKIRPRRRRRSQPVERGSKALQVLEDGFFLAHRGRSSGRKIGFYRRAAQPRHCATGLDGCKRGPGHYSPRKVDASVMIEKSASSLWAGWGSGLLDLNHTRMPTFASVLLIAKFAPSPAAQRGEFRDWDTRPASRGGDGAWIAWAAPQDAPSGTADVHLAGLCSVHRR